MTAASSQGSKAQPTRLSLGPILFHWDAAAKRDFYFRIADEAPVDTVYLGEVVCSKRAPFFEKELPEIAGRLARAGKEVVYSSLALVMSAREATALRDLAVEDSLLVELNDLAGADVLAGRPHVIGPFVNVYNESTLAYFARRGARRVVLPAEFPKHLLAPLRQGCPDVTLEIQSFGRIPLALSARCYHARAHGLHKDGCQYVCALDQDGMPVSTLDGDGFLAVSGTMTLSFAYLSRVNELLELRDTGVTGFRLWPHAIDMVAVAQSFRDVLDGRKEGAKAEADLQALLPGVRFSRSIYERPLQPAS